MANNHGQGAWHRFVVKLGRYKVSFSPLHPKAPSERDMRGASCRLSRLHRFIMPHQLCPKAASCNIIAS